MTAFDFKTQLYRCGDGGWIIISMECIVGKWFATWEQAWRELWTS